MNIQPQNIPIDINPEDENAFEKVIELAKQTNRKATLLEQRVKILEERVLE